jgi:hypothetical protein
MMTLLDRTEHGKQRKSKLIILAASFWLLIVMLFLLQLCVVEISGAKSCLFQAYLCANEKMPITAAKLQLSEIKPA